MTLYLQIIHKSEDYVKNKGIAFKLSLYILASCSVIFIAIFGYNYLVSRSLLIKNIENDAKDLAALTVSRIETVIRSVEQVPKNLAYFLEETDSNKEAVINMLYAIVVNNEGVYGSTIAFEPYACDKDVQHFAPYYHKTDKDLVYVDLADGSYRYFEWPWYTIPKESGHAMWSEPYYDEGGGNVIMSTYSVPFYRNKSGVRKFAGVVTADIDLKWLQEMVASIKIGKTGYAF